MEKHLIAITTICSQYEVEFSFIDALHSYGLLTIETVEKDRYIHQDHINDLEKMIRLHHELNVNIEGIDVVFNLLEKEKALREEVVALKNRLKRFEDDTL